MSAHVLSGLLAAVAAVLAVAQLGSAQPTIGADWLLLSFAAPIIGGAALTGGHISVLGTMFAVVLIGLIQNGMVLAKVDPYWVQFVLGALILAAVGLNRWRAVNSGSGLTWTSRSKSVSKSFPGVKALDGVSLDLKAGRNPRPDGRKRRRQVDADQDRHRSLSAPIPGRVLLDGRAVQFGSPRDALGEGVSAVHQERNLIPRFCVGENILLERLPTRNGLVDYGAVEREARRYLDLLDPGIDARAEVRSLSVAQMQIVEIAKALSLEAKILLLDEPTASITEHETAALFKLLRKLREDGVAIVFVSHKLEEVFAIADRVTVLRDGKNVARGAPMAEMTRQTLVSLMIGRDERVAEIGERQIDPSRVVLEARGLSTTRGHRTSASPFTMAKSSDCTASSAPDEANWRTPSSATRRISGGELLIRGRRSAFATCTTRRRRFRMGYVSEDRKQEGLILMHSITRNVAITIWRRLANAIGLINPRRRDARRRPLRRAARRSHAIARTSRRQSLRRKSAEGFDRQMAGGGVRNPHHRRADGRHRHQDQDLPARTDRRDRPRGRLRSPHLERHGGNDHARRPNPRHARLSPGRRGRQRSSLRDDEQGDHGLHSCGRRVEPAPAG